MAYCFGDSFDLYKVEADLLNYWDGGSLNISLQPGRFSGGRSCANGASGGWVFKSSGANDAVHHIVCATQQASALSGASLGIYFIFSDGATNQCSIVFRQDGAILLTSGGQTGTVLATYPNAVTLVNQWFAFEFEVIIHPTAGRFRVRKNNNTVDDFDSGAVLNTRVSANSYANKLSIGNNNNFGPLYIDDLLWRSDASSVPFVGDIRCYVRMPASDASVVFSRSPSPVVMSQTAASSGTTSKAANLGIMSAFTPAFSGTISSGTVQVSTGGTGNMKAAIYDATRTTVLATSNAVVNPTAGANTITFGTPLTVTKGVVYHLAVDQDFTIVYNTTSATQWSFTTTYASFPAASPSLSSSTTGPVCTVNITPTVNAEFVNETLQDGTTSYVFDSTVGHADFYTLAPLGVTPASVIATITRGFVCKSDAGTRTGAVQLKSGGTTVASSAPALSTSFGWLWRSDVVDPATGSAWTPAAVNGATIGPTVTS